MTLLCTCKTHIRVNRKMCLVQNETYIFVVDTFEKYQLPVGTFSMGLVLEGPTQLFHCYWYTKDCIQSRAAHTLYIEANRKAKVIKEERVNVSSREKWLSQL